MVWYRVHCNKLLNSTKINSKILLVHDFDALSSEFQIIMFQINLESPSLWVCAPFVVVTNFSFQSSSVLASLFNALLPSNGNSCLNYLPWYVLNTRIIKKYEKYYSTGNSIYRWTILTTDMFKTIQYSDHLDFIVGWVNWTK